MTSTTEKTVKHLKAYGQYIVDNAELIVGSIDHPTWITEGDIHISFTLLEHESVPTLDVSIGGNAMTENAKDLTCEFCEPWYDPKPLVETPKLIVRLVVKDDMSRYVQLLRKGLFGGWREFELVAIDKCPICGREV